MKLWTSNFRARILKILKFIPPKTPTESEIDKKLIPRTIINRRDSMERKNVVESVYIYPQAVFRRENPKD